MSDDQKKGLLQGFKRMFPQGLKAAAQMLQRLDPKARERILDEIAKKDHRVYEHIKNNLVTFPDLIYLTPQMIRDLLREIPLEQLGLALRGSEKKLIDHFLVNMSQNNQVDVTDVLKGKPRPLSEVLEAQDKILAIVLVKIEKGQIVLNPEGDKLV